jgi:hypothetical protein
LEIVALARHGLHLSPFPNCTACAFDFRRHRTEYAPSAEPIKLKSSWPIIGLRMNPNVSLDLALRGWLHRYPLARNGEFVEPDQADLGCPVPFAKIFLFSRNPNHFYIFAIPSHSEGRFAIVTDVGRDAVDADALEDEQRVTRTAKTCGPDAPTLASSSR